MEVTLNLSKEELVELSKMAYIAQFVMDSSGELNSTEPYLGIYQYPKLTAFYSALREINKVVLTHVPDCEILDVDERSESRFVHNYKMDTEMEQVIETFSNDLMNDVVCYAVTKNEFEKDYPELEIPMFRFGDGPFDILYNRNMKEIEQNGFENLWLLHNKK